MKIALAFLALVLAVVFAVVAVQPMLDLQDDAEALALDAPASSLFGNVGNFGVILSVIVAVVFLFGSLTLVLRGR